MSSEKLTAHVEKHLKVRKAHDCYRVEYTIGVQRFTVFTAAFDRRTPGDAKDAKVSADFIRKMLVKAMVNMMKEMPK